MTINHLITAFTVYTVRQFTVASFTMEVSLCFPFDETRHVNAIRPTGINQVGTRAESCLVSTVGNESKMFWSKKAKRVIFNGHEKDVWSFGTKNSSSKGTHLKVNVTLEHSCITMYVCQALAAFHRDADRFKYHLISYSNVNSAI